MTFYPSETQWPQIVTLQSVEHHTGLAHHLWFFDIWAARQSAQMSKIKDGGLDQYEYGAQRSEVYLGRNVTDRQYCFYWSAAVIMF